MFERVSFDSDDVREIAWYVKTTGPFNRANMPRIQPVAQKRPNAWGLYDMLGNVAEWAYGPKGRRDSVLRGGHYKIGPVHCRSASRIELQPDTRPTDYMGYRLVLRPVEQ